jgi:CheY-like chemotaxis protein
LALIFSALLPSVAEFGAAAGHTMQARSGGLAGSTILVVEDRREALALVEAESITVDAVLTDLAMPELGGQKWASGRHHPKDPRAA